MSSSSYFGEIADRKCTGKHTGLKRLGSVEINSEKISYPLTSMDALIARITQGYMGQGQKDTLHQQTSKHVYRAANQCAY